MYVFTYFEIIKSFNFFLFWKEHEITNKLTPKPRQQLNLKGSYATFNPIRAIFLQCVSTAMLLKIGTL